MAKREKRTAPALPEGPFITRDKAFYKGFFSLLIIITGLIWMVGPQLYTSIETIIINSGDYVDKADAWISRFFMNYPEVEATVSGMFGDGPFAGGRVARAAEAADAGHAVQREPEGSAEEAEADDRDVCHGVSISRFHTG